MTSYALANAAGISTSTLSHMLSGKSGYFVIITSEKTAQALEHYKSRDVSEKLFHGSKSYLGNRSFRVHAKAFIEFVTLTIHNRFYGCLKEQVAKNGKKNQMISPVAIRELAKLEKLMQKRYKFRGKKLKDAFTNSESFFEEVMRFLAEKRK